MKTPTRFWLTLLICMAASVLASCGSPTTGDTPPATSPAVSQPVSAEPGAKPTDHSLIIDGPPEFRDLVNNALALLKDKTPKHCQDVTQVTRFIRYVPDRPVGDFVAYSSVREKDDDTVYIVKLPQAGQYQTVAMAAILVHEAEHLYQADLPAESRMLMIENHDLSEYHAMVAEMDALKYLDPPKYLLDQRTAKYREKQKKLPKGPIQFDYDYRYQ